MNELSKMVLVTTVICAFSATLLGSLKHGLKDRIEAQEDIYIRGPAIHALLNGCPNDPLADKITLSAGDEKVDLYPWIEEGKVRRVAFERKGSGGYGGDVVVMTAIDLESDKIFGVQVTQHKETPGVGTRAMEENYLMKYFKLSLDKPIALKKNGGSIDAVSGATKTSKGIADAVNHAATFINRHKVLVIKEITSKKSH